MAHRRSEPAAQHHSTTTTSTTRRWHSQVTELKPAGGNPREARGCGEEQVRAETLGRGGAGGRGRGCGEGARVWEVASEGQPDGVGGEESAQQQTAPVRPFFFSRDDL